jgi:hypothetical protein
VLVLLAYWASARLLGVRPEIGTSVTSVLGFGILPHLLALYLMSRVVLVAVVRTRTFKAARDGLRRDLLRAETLERLAGIPLFVLGTVFMFDVFGAFKGAIPRFSTYDWDETLAGIDAFLHGGADPWTWTHTLFGAAGTQVLDQIYVSWFSVLLLSILLTATWAPLALRARFFLALALTCALAGSLAATLFASGGPVYFGEFAGDGDRFFALLEGLEGTVAQRNHVALWEAFATQSDKLYGGISAMPSMHVTLTALVALAAFTWHPLAGAVAGLYTLLILTGSVHLAWHYAIDGYAGIALAAIIWFGVGRIEMTPHTGREPAWREGVPEPAVAG